MWAFFFQDDWKLSREAQPDPGSALRDRIAAAGALQPFRPRVRPQRATVHRSGGAGGLRQEPDAGGSGQPVPRGRRCDVCRRRRPAERRLEPRQEQLHAAHRPGVSRDAEDRGPDQLRHVLCLHGRSPRGRDHVGLLQHHEPGADARRRDLHSPRIANPFPNGISEPVGAALGAATFLGQGISFFEPNLKTPYNQRWQFGIQRELPWRTVLEITYTGQSRNGPGSYPRTQCRTDPVPEHASHARQRTEHVPDRQPAESAGRPAAGNLAQWRQPIAPDAFHGVSSVHRREHDHQSRLFDLPLRSPSKRTAASRRGSPSRADIRGPSLSRPPRI